MRDERKQKENEGERIKVPKKRVYRKDWRSKRANKLIEANIVIFRCV